MVDMIFRLKKLAMSGMRYEDKFTLADGSTNKQERLNQLLKFSL